MLTNKKNIMTYLKNYIIILNTNKHLLKYDRVITKIKVSQLTLHILPPRHILTIELS